jgi:hypothetical protein
MPYARWFFGGSSQNLQNMVPDFSLRPTELCYLKKKIGTARKHNI